ncbi:MAG: ribose-phosphate pyrophosphokinase [Deltaproteobacteria bacterium]|nr:ribose-phosphate pyrophosphokinase [Deltaproteobacteria bacterium]
MIVSNPIVFSTLSYRALADSIAARGGFERGAVEARHFPDGEVYHRIDSRVAGRHVAVVGGTIDDADTLEIYDLACGLVKNGVQSLSLAVPYFGYSTMERATKPGEIVKAKTRARLFSSIPQSDSGNRMLLLDLHAEGIPHYFEGGIRPVHLSARELIEQAARKLAGKDFVIASTDAGRAKWVEALANSLRVPAALVIKRRLDATQTEIVAVSAEVRGRDVVIYDDMVRTGGSLREAAKAYREAGARRIFAIATHGVLPGDSLARLEASGLFEAIVTTDSHPRAAALASSFLSVVSVADLFASVIGGVEAQTFPGGR